MTFVDWDDVPRWALINKALGLNVPEPVETYSSSPHLYTDLDIPEGTKGRLPRNKRMLAGVDAEVLEDLGETGKKNSRSRSGGRQGGSGRDGGRTRDGKSADSAGSKGEGGRNRTRRRRTSDAEGTATAAPRESAEGASEKPARTRRTRTRRRNGEVVSGEAAGTTPATTEA